MNFLLIINILGWVINLIGIFFLPASIVGFIYGETDHALIYLILCFVYSVIGLLFKKVKRPNTTFYAKEGFVTVALSWIALSLLGAVPFVLTGDIPSYTDALFETVSGFTTTGASILDNVEGLSHCNLFFRCFTNWIGGMGVLVFILAIIPMTGGSTMNIMKAESTGPSVGKLVPKIQSTAKILYLIYVGLTFADFVMLLFGNIGVFDSLCLSIATAGTGGFAVLNSSIGSYSSYVVIVTTVFMFLFGINFTFFYSLLIRHSLKEAFAMTEVRTYFAVYFIASLLIMGNLFITHSYVGNTATTVRDVFFTVSSLITTTGFSTADFNLWPTFSKFILVILMFTGACAGSTSGGVKLSRILIYFKEVKKELMYQAHPNRIRVITMDGKPVPSKVIHSTNVLLMSYIIIFFISYGLLALDGFDTTTNLTSVFATLGNIGPGLGMVGPCGNFASFSALSKYTLMFDMLAGRLELIPMMVLFYPGTWKK